MQWVSEVLKLDEKTVPNLALFEGRLDPLQRQECAPSNPVK